MYDSYTWIDQLIELFQTADGTVGDVSTTFSDIASIFDNIAAIGTSIVTVISFLVSVVGIIVAAVYFIIKYFMRAIPMYKVAKNANCEQAMLVWIPVFQSLFCVYVLSKISGKEEFELFNGRIRFKDKTMPMLAYCFVYFFADAIITVIILAANVIPGLGQVISCLGILLYFLPNIFCGLIKHVFLRDTLNLFEADLKKNKKHSFFVCVLDAFISSEWAMIFYMVTLMRKKPLSKRE